MSTRETGGAAFPRIYPNVDEPGMTLRDYFAGQALGAIAAIYRGDNGGGVGSEHFPRNVAAHAYKLADAMLAERAK